MSIDSAPIAPFPGIPTTYDLSGTTLTLYYEPDPATGQIPQKPITSTTAWTAAEIRTVLAEHGVRPATRGHRAGDALVTALAGLITVGERLSAASAVVAHGWANAISAPLAPHGPRA